MKKRCEMQFTVIRVSVFFRAALFGRLRSWLGEVLGVELESTVDISCAKYEHTGEIWSDFLMTNLLHVLIFSIYVTFSHPSRRSFVS